jgi:hypothetical protein
MDQTVIQPKKTKSQGVLQRTLIMDDPRAGMRVGKGEPEWPPYSKFLCGALP